MGTKHFRKRIIAGKLAPAGLTVPSPTRRRRKIR
jgi:hypothetical protein